MAGRRSKKAARSPARRLLLGLVLVVILLVGIVAATQPRQLPGIIADQPAVRVVYSWKDAINLWIHRQLYPLSDLRTDAVPAVKTGTGYTDQDRAALDDLIDAKNETKDTP